MVRRFAGKHAFTVRWTVPGEGAQPTYGGPEVAFLVADRNHDLDLGLFGRQPVTCPGLGLQ